MTGRYQPPRSNQQLPPAAGPGNGVGVLRERQGSAKKKRRGQGTLLGLVPRRRLCRGLGSSGYWSADPWLTASNASTAWDWHVTRTADNEFTVVFRDATSHGYATRSADMTLALNKLMVDISEQIRDPKVVAVLNTAWILIFGLPDIARPDRVIRKM
ncbi:hypothetical protein D1007_42203 [Hordeum vulgare]|nr:hypothetical protein D1007_42203 [Hordeum vulgare]